MWARMSPMIIEMKPDSRRLHWIKEMGETRQQMIDIFAENVQELKQDLKQEFNNKFEQQAKDITSIEQKNLKNTQNLNQQIEAGQINMGNRVINFSQQINKQIIDNQGNIKKGWIQHSDKWNKE